MRDNNRFDEILTLLGTGSWNLIYFVANGFWYFLWAPQAISVVYIAPHLSYTCLSPDNTTSLSKDSCSYFKLTENGEVEEACTEWDFDDTVFSNTLTSEFQLVCERAYLRAVYQSIYTFGSLFTLGLIGYAADRHGRKKVVVVTHLLGAAVNIAISFQSSITAVLTLRCMQGMMANTILYILAMEVCEVKQRSAVGILIGLPWALGTMAWGGLGYFIRDWRKLNLAVSLPRLLIVVPLYLMDESPRWLMVTGQQQKALAVVQRAARLNGVTTPPEEYVMNLIGEREEPKMGREAAAHRCRPLFLPKLLSTPTVRLLIILISVIYFLTSLVFVGLNLSGAVFHVDPFLYMVVGGLMELPGYTLTAPVIHRWGRKWPSIIGFLVCGVTILSLAFIPADISWLVMTLAMMGKMAISGAYMALVVHVAELLPTEVRMQGKSLVMVMLGVAYCIAPFITDMMAPLVPWLPSVLFGVSSMIVALLLVTLPETCGKALPEVVADLDILWRKKS